MHTRSDEPYLNVSPKQLLTTSRPYDTSLNAPLLHCGGRTTQAFPELGIEHILPTRKPTISNCTGAGVIGSGRPAPPLVFFHSTSLAFNSRGSASPRIRKIPHIPPREAKANPTFEVAFRDELPRRRSWCPAEVASGKSCLQDRQLIWLAVDLQFQRGFFQAGIQFGPQGVGDFCACVAPPG